MKDTSTGRSHLVDDMPFDMWSGTIHDRSPEALAAMRETRKFAHNLVSESA